MRVVKIKSGAVEGAAIETERGFVMIKTLNEEKRSEWPENYEDYLSGGKAAPLVRWYEAGGAALLENINRRFVIEREKAEITDGPFDVRLG